MDDAPRMYRDLAPWWHLFSAPGHYAREAAHFRDLFTAHPGRPVRTVLELGCGGGNNASHLKAWFELTLVDRSPEMLAQSRKLNPECEHLEGDMRDLRLGRRFDAVFIHDAIMYLSTEAELRAAMETAFAHLEPGGIALFVPDHTRESFGETTSHGGHDGPDRGLRYLEWVSDPDPLDTAYTVDFAFLLREPDGTVRVLQDRHVLGLFPRREWLRFMKQSGFTPRSVPDEFGRDIFIGASPTPPPPLPPR